MSLNIFLVLALAVSATWAAQCGVPAIEPTSSFNLDAVIAHLTGKSDGRIVGGVEAIPHSFPWQTRVSIRYQGSTYGCGGSIIDSQHVMTAAHCVVFGRPVAGSAVTVRVGAHDLRKTTEVNAKTVNVARVTVHPSYAGEEYDFAILKLAEPLTLSREVSPICLATAEDGPVGQRCYVTGWGSTIQNDHRPGVRPPSDAPTNLRQVQVGIISNDQCTKSYSPTGFPIAAAEICATAPGKDSCQGDSGGPFACKRASGEYALVGVVSWGLGCADARYPGVYARTSTVLPWIASVVSA